MVSCPCGLYRSIEHAHKYWEMSRSAATRADSQIGPRDRNVEREREGEGKRGKEREGETGREGGGVQESCTCRVSSAGVVNRTTTENFNYNKKNK